MLYISSRNKTDAFTANRALCEEYAADGGLFLPYQLPEIDAQTLNQMCESSFAENIARVLNLFFSANISSWDMECCIGRSCVRIKQMNHRILSAECFHNPQNTYHYLVESIFRLLLQGKVAKPTQWAKIATRIATLFALYAMMPADVRESFDVALPTGDFSDPMAVWYARKMGLPVRKIICCCNANGAVWDLIHRGEMNTGAAVVDTGMRQLDHACPVHIERLIYHTLGPEEALKYVQTCGKKGVYHVDEENLPLLNEGIFAAVVGQERIPSTVRSVFRSNEYIISPTTAIAFGGLQDFRAKSGESQYTLILADESPACYADQVSAACAITKADLMKTLSSVKE